MQQTVKNKELENTSRDPDSIIKFSFGTSMIIDRINNEVSLLNNTNELQLSIKVTSEGLMVIVNAAKLSIEATEELNLVSKKINIEASQQLKLKSDGNLIEQVKKDLLSEVGGTNKQIAKVQKIKASLGNVEIKANDYVKLDGESVLLNCEE